MFGFLLGGCAEAYFATLLGDLVDSLGEQIAQPSLLIPVLMLTTAVARGIGAFVGEVLLSQISLSVVHNIRTQLFDQLLSMPSAYFDASSQGHLVSRITYNVAQLRSAGTDALKSVVSDGGKTFLYVGTMLYISWKLTLIFAATAPIVALVVVYASRRFRRISRRIQNSMGDVTHVASETVAGYRVVRVFGGENYERDRFNKSSHYNRRQNLKMVVTKVSSTQTIQIFVATALSILVAVLYNPEISGDLSTGEMVTFLTLAGLLTRPIRKLTEVNATLQRGLAAAEDVFGQLDQAEENDEGELEVERVQGRIEFRDLNFTYEQGSGAVLKSLNVIIEPGQTVALVGKSGSGKSTFASLIPRFYEPDSGSILLDGEPLGKYKLTNLRRQIALVTQQVTLFNDTLERNIAYGALANASAEQIDDAIKRAHADPFIADLPLGLQTVVGDDGVLLSGGQRQRVAIARALLKDAPVLILDEATSALDTASERHIQAALEEVMRGRTTIVIAHRLSTIENADVILVMDEGRIVESGDHESLLALEGTYAELYNAQFEDAGVTRKTTGESKPRLPHVTLALPGAERTLSSLSRAWYAGAWWLNLLLPLSWLFAKIAARRRLQYLTGAKVSWRASVPVVVVGNITAGGTGKTPFVIWLAARLLAMGFRPGIVSSGYGGRSHKTPQLVTADSSPEQVGDEAPILAARTGLPVVVCSDRSAAVKEVIDAHGCDIVVTDDGLQHYALARDVEIAVVDGHRGVGNGACLPAGPLREPVSRLAEVDWVISTGRPSGLHPEESLMRVVPLRFVRLTSAGASGSPGQSLSCDEFVSLYCNVNAVAGVGNPVRFAQTLRDLNLNPVLHAYDDHHKFDGSELVFENDWPIVCTEKDATKISELTEFEREVWYLEIDVELDVGAERRLETLLLEHGITCQ